jgi:glutamyl-tRNA synthetase
MERVHKGGAKFDFEKAKWFNHEWIKKSPASRLSKEVASLLAQHNIEVNNNQLLDTVIDLVKERCTLVSDFVQQSSFFFSTPEKFDTASIQPKWDATKNQFFIELANAYASSILWESSDLEKEFKELAAAHQLKPGELMLPLRSMLVGGKFGPGVFDIAALIGKEATVSRIKTVVGML